MPWTCMQNWEINPLTLTSKPSPLRGGKRNVFNNTDHKRGGIKSINAHMCNVCKIGIDTHIHTYTNHNTEKYLMQHFQILNVRCDLHSDHFHLTTSLWDRKQRRHYTTFANFLDFVMREICKNFWMIINALTVLKRNFFFFYQGWFIPPPFSWMY